MKPYKDKGGRGGIVAYEAGSNFILIRFKDGNTYLYDDKVPGKKHVAKMKVLAEEGEGLTTYINQHVREHYAKKLD